MANDIGIRIGAEGLSTYLSDLNRAQNAGSRFASTTQSGVNGIGESLRESSGLASRLAQSLNLVINPIEVIQLGARAIGGAFRSTIGAAADFQQQLVNVGALLQVDRNSEAFASLTAEAERLGRTTEFSATEAGQAMEFLARAGFDASETLAGTERTLALATIGQLELGRAADIATDTLSQFQIPVSQLGSVVDILAKTTVTANTNVEQLANALNYLGPTANALGVSLEESAAAIGILSSSGLKGSLATRALGTSLVNLTKPTAAAAAAMEQYNISAFEDGNFVGLAGLVKQLERSFEGLSDEARQAAIANIFGAEAVQEINILLAQGSDELERYTEELRKAGEGNGEFSANLQADLLQSFNGALKLLESAATGLAISIGDNLLPILTDMALFFADALNVVTDFTGSMDSLGNILIQNADILGIAAGALIAWNATAIQAAIQSIPALAASILASTKAFVAQAASSRIAIAAQALYITGSQLLRGSITAATAAQRVFNVVFAANPVALIGTLIASAAAAMFLFRKRTEETTQASGQLKETNDQLVDSITSEVTGLQKLFGPLRDENASREDKKKAIDAINKQYGPLLGNMLTEKSSAEDIAQAYRDVTKAIVLKQVAQEQEQKINQLISSAIQFEKDREAQQRRVNEQRQLGIDLAAEEGAVFGSNAYILQSLAAGQQETLDNTQQFLEQNVNQIEGYYSRLSENLINVFSNIDLGFLSADFKSIDGVVEGTESKVKSLGQALAELGVDLEALNRFNELSGLAEAIPLESIRSAAERAKEAMFDFGFAPTDALQDLEQMLSNINAALKIIDPSSAGFEQLARYAGILEARIARVNNELDRLSEGGPRQPIVFPIEADTTELENVTLSPPGLELRADLKIDIPNGGSLATLAEAAKVLGVDVGFLNDNFADTAELLGLMEGRAFKLGEALSGSTQKGLEFGIELRELWKEIGEQILTNFANMLPELGAQIGTILRDTIGKGSEAQQAAVADLENQIASLDAALADLPKDSESFKTIERQANSLRGQLNALESVSGRVGAAFADFARQVLAMVLSEGTRIAGIYLMQASLTLGPAGIPVFLAGAALAGLSGLIPKLLLPEDDNAGFNVSTPDFNSDGFGTGGVGGGGNFGGAAGFTTGELVQNSLNTIQAAGQPTAVNVVVQLDSEEISTALTVYSTIEQQLTGG